MYPIYLLIFIRTANAFCPEKNFNCDYFRCISSNKTCNGIYDCYDKTDENNCYKSQKGKGSKCKPFIHKKFFCDKKKNV